MAKAAELYRQVLAVDPGHPDANHFLGIIVMEQEGNYDGAVQLLQRSIRANPKIAEAHNNLGNALQKTGRIDEAIGCYRQALALKPGLAEIHINLGNALREAGRPEEAVDCFRQALAIRPDFAEVHYRLANALQESGRLEEAIASFRQALALQPGSAPAWNELGNALRESGRPEEAVDSFRQALAIRPDFAEALNNLGSALQESGEREEALDCLRKALTIKPHFAAAHNNLGNGLFEAGKLEEAAASFRKALSLEPGFIAAHYNLANALLEAGELEEASSSFEKALALNPEFAEAHYNFGNLLQQAGKIKEAIASLRKALALNPDYTVAHTSLLYCFNFLPGRPEADYNEAIRRYGRNATAKVGARYEDWACTPEPERLRVGLVSGDFRNHPVGYFLENLLTNIDPNRIELIAYPTHHQEDDLTTRLRPHFAAWKPLQGLDDEEAARLIHDDGVHVLLDLSGHTRYNRLPVFAWKPAPVQASWLGYFASTGVAEMDYLIADPVSVPESHQETGHGEGTRFEANNYDICKRSQGAADARHRPASTTSVCEQDDNKMPPDSQQPDAPKSPVQNDNRAGWTVGSSTDKADAVPCDRLPHQEYFSERIWYLPETRLCFSPPAPEEKLTPTPLPALRDGAVTFGCFQKLAKINDEVLAAWGRILQALPRARLRLQNYSLHSRAAREQLQRRLTCHGIAPERVTLEKPASRMEYLAAHDQIDMILDTFPFPGGTTTCEALWMGVPTVTLAGGTMLGRQGASLLACAGLTDWIAVDDEDYVTKAVTHAGDLKKLARLRAGLRGQVLASPLFDAPRFARNFEAALWGMWHYFQQKNESQG